MPWCLGVAKARFHGSFPAFSCYICLAVFLAILAVFLRFQKISGGSPWRVCPSLLGYPIFRQIQIKPLNWYVMLPGGPAVVTEGYFKGLRLTAGRRPSNLGTMLALCWAYVGLSWAYVGPC